MNRHEFTAYQSLADQAKENKRQAHSARERNVQAGYRHARERAHMRHMRRWALAAMPIVWLFAVGAAVAYNYAFH